MSENPYQAPLASPTRRLSAPYRSATMLGVFACNIVLMLLGLTVGALSMLPSDVPKFFLLSGMHLIASSLLGAICSWGQQSRLVVYLLPVTSLLVNASLAVRVVFLFLDGTIRGPLVVAAPVLIGIPVLLNVVVAIFIIGKSAILSRRSPGVS
jgi:hypothetical protein